MKKSIISSMILILVTFILASCFQVAYAAKGFVVEKGGSDKVLITDGYSEYVIEHDYSCYSSNFYDGATIYIDTSYSPSYGDKIIIPGYSNTVCEVTSSDDVNIKRYYVDDVFDSEDKIIVTDKNSDRFLVEYGIGCGLSMWRYEGKTIDIDIGGSFLDGIGDRIYLFDSGRDCKVWDVEELSGSGGGSTYIPPTPTISCPANSSAINGQCACNSGYKANGSACITYTQSCQNQYGVNSYGDKQYCYCSNGYEFNSDKTSCNKIEIKPIPQPSPVKTPKTEPTFLQSVVPPKEQAATTLKQQEPEKSIVDEASTTPQATTSQIQEESFKEKPKLFYKKQHSHSIRW